MSTMDGGAPQVIGWDDLDKRKLYVIGPTASLIVRAILYPPMLIKTRLQVRDSPYKGTADAFRKVYRQEGFRALYKGFPTNCIGLGVGQVYITIYEVSRKHAAKFGLTHGSCNFVAGASAATISQCLVVPIDVVTQLQMVQGQGQAAEKPPGAVATVNSSVRTAGTSATTQPTREQRRSLHTEPARSPAEKVPGTAPQPTSSGGAGSSQPSTPSASSTPSSSNARPTATQSASQIVRQLYNNEGLRGLYRGYGASVMTYIPSSAIWWASYGVTSTYMHGVSLVSGVPTPLINAACGGTAGFVASVATNPLDVIRTRLQVEGSRSGLRIMQILMKEDGYRWFARGLVARIMSAVPAGAVIITSYETVKRLSVHTS